MTIGPLVTIYERGGHLGHVTCIIYIYFLSSFPRRLHINLALIGQAVIEKKIFENGGHIQVYIARGQGQTTPWIKFFHLFSQLSHLLQVFPNK